MRRLWALIRTEFLREFSSPVTLVFFLVLPLIFTAAVGAALGGMGGGDEPAEEVDIHIYVVDEDGGSLAAAFIDTLESTNLVPEEAAALPVDYFGLVIPPDFSEDLLAGSEVTLTLQTVGDSTVSPAVEQAVGVAQRRLAGAAQVARSGLEERSALRPFDSQAEEEIFFRSLLEDALAAAEDAPAVPEVVWAAGAEVDESTNFATGAEQASAGQIVTWVQITLLGAAEILVGERIRGTLRRMLIMPTSRANILTGKLIARLLLGLLQMTILLLSGAFLFGVGWGSDPLAVALVSFAFSLSTVSLGVLLGTIVRTRGQASSLVIGMSMAMAALGGAWYPLEITPQIYRQVVKMLPSTWAMRAYTDMLARGAGARDILPEVGVLLGFAAIFFVAGMLRFRRYEQ